jgi:hypothetical protein
VPSDLHGGFWRSATHVALHPIAGDEVSYDAPYLSVSASSLFVRAVNFKYKEFRILNSERNGVSVIVPNG